MAKAKYFHVTETTSGKEHLVKAPRKSLVLQLVTGGRAGVKPASDEDITNHLTSGGALHEKSKPEGEGKLFLVAGERPSLVRAKNAGEAFSLVNDGTYEVQPASQDALVRLLSAGLKVVEYQEPEANKSAEASASSTDTAAVAGDSGVAANDDIGTASADQAQTPAAPVPEASASSEPATTTEPTANGAAA